MRPCRVVPSALALALIAPFIALVSSWNTAHAQAWVGDKGNLDVSLDYNLAISSKVVEDGGQNLENAGTTTQQITLGGEYVPIHNLAASISLPLVFLKYTGDLTKYQHLGGGKYDDGATHVTLTDLRATARYQLFEDPVAFAPHI